MSPLVPRESAPTTLRLVEVPLTEVELAAAGVEVVGPDTLENVAVLVEALLDEETARPTSAGDDIVMV